MLEGNDADEDTDGSESEGEDGLDLKGMFDDVPHDNSDLQCDVQGDVWGDDDLESQFSPIRDTPPPPPATAAAATMTTATVEVHRDPDVSDFDSDLNTPHRPQTCVSDQKMCSLHSPVEPYCQNF